MQEFHHSLTVLLSQYLKISESFVHKSSSLFYSLEKVRLKSIFGRQMDLHGQATIRFPSSIDSPGDKQSIVFIRVNLPLICSYIMIVIRRCRSLLNDWPEEIRCRGSLRRILLDRCRLLF